MRFESLLAYGLLIGTTMSAQNSDVQVYRPGAGIRNPVPVHSVKGARTPAATAAGLVGYVAVEAVVLPDGTVGAVKISKSCLGTTPNVPTVDMPCVLPSGRDDAAANGRGSDDPTLGLNRAALDAASRWTFRPARRNGVPVAITVIIEIEFKPGNDTISASAGRPL